MYVGLTLQLQMAISGAYGELTIFTMRWCGNVDGLVILACAECRKDLIREPPLGERYQPMENL